MLQKAENDSVMLVRSTERMIGKTCSQSSIILRLAAVHKGLLKSIEKLASVGQVFLFFPIETGNFTTMVSNFRDCFQIPQFKIPQRQDRSQSKTCFFNFD
jgi:hypothetical protein